MTTQIKFFNNSFSDKFYELDRDLILPHAVPEAEVNEYSKSNLVDAAMRGASCFVYDAILRNGNGIIHSALIDAADVASNILRSRKFSAAFLDCYSACYKLDNPTTSEFDELHQQINTFLSGKFFVSTDDFLGAKAHALIYRAGPKRGIYLNRLLTLSLDTYTTQKGISSEEGDLRLKKAIAFLVIKLVHEVAHWLNTWMQSDLFYNCDTEEFTNKTSPSLMKFGFKFADFGNIVESTIFDGYADLVVAPHRFIGGLTSRSSITEVHFYVFSEGKQTTYRYIPHTGPFTLANIGLGVVSEDSRITLGGRMVVAPKRAPDSVATKVTEEKEGSRKSKRMVGVLSVFE